MIINAKMAEPGNWNLKIVRVQVTAFEPLPEVPANTPGAYAISLLRQGWWNLSDLTHAVRSQCNGKGTKAYDMIKRLRQARLLEERGTRQNREYRVSYEGANPCAAR